MNFNATNYKEHLKEYFNQSLKKKKNISVFFIYEKLLCPQTSMLNNMENIFWATYGSDTLRMILKV